MDKGVRRHCKNALRNLNTTKKALRNNENQNENEKNYTTCHFAEHASAI